jgi:hypothetical protein
MKAIRTGARRCPLVASAKWNTAMSVRRLPSPSAGQYIRAKRPATI